MTDATAVTPSKPAITSQTIQGAVVQFVISLTALVVIFFPKEADKITSVSGMIQGYVPVILAVVAAVAPLVMTVLGRFKAVQPLH